MLNKFGLGPRMSVQYPSHLYIRIDRSLRAALLSAAEEAGQSVSAFTRAILRGSVVQRAAASSADGAINITPVIPTKPGEEGCLTFRGEIRQRKGVRS